MTEISKPLSNKKSALRAYLGLYIAIIAGIIITLLPLGDGIPTAGQNMIAILVFAIIVWISEAIDYTSSAIVISALIIFMVGFAPNIDHPEAIAGTTKALRMTLSGFSNAALALVAAAMFIAAAMTVTGLDKRIALFTMARIGASSRSILIGAIVVTVVLSLVVPSATARTACVVPIMMGVIAAFKVDQHSRLAASMMIVVAQATSIWNVGIQTSAAQNLLSIGFINKTFGAEHSISWLDWLLAGAPWSIAMSVVLFFLVRKMMPPETEAVEGGVEAIKQSLIDLGPTTAKEKRLIAISILLLLFWATGGKLHNIDTTSVTLAGLAIMLMPGIGVMGWKDVEKRVQWGTLLMFGIGISLGSALLDTQAASWLANYVVKGFNLHALPPIGILAILAAFLIIIHLGFASATALTAALLPILISLLSSLPPELGVNPIGMTIILAFTVSFGFILPINAPQNMVCLGTDTFSPRQFTRIGIGLTIVGYLMLLFFAATLWPALGLM
ncbi:DASS family sodium-coupled anion symporter [Brenneria populi subsp. brevivirga]|uniref:DASS family sodium-coupled anion symporter n=1 Tax=Brenneria populi TaxID=1505588 RepID=UPI002E196ADD|nr:DASS family sodium-coupled anion symporter [Brenneria populi subsp. brevivirga]